MDEQERLENDANTLKKEIKELQIKKSQGKLENDNILKEKKTKLVRILTDLELASIALKNESRSR